MTVQRTSNQGCVFFVVSHSQNAENNSMKISSSVFFALLVAAVSLQCSKNAELVEELPELEVVEEPLPLETFIDGKILSKRADLCLFGRDSAMHSVIKLSCGDDISVLEIDGVIDEKFVPDEKEGEADVKNDSRSAIGENPELPQKGTEYVHVVHENMDFWLEKSVFALRCENAVAIEKTFLYADPNLTQKLESPQSPLKFAEKIAKAKDVAEAGSVETGISEAGESKTLDSAKVFFYDTKEKSVREAFVLASSISTRKDDIVVSQIAEELKVTKRAVPRNELFAKAAKYKPCKKVLAALNAQKVETKTYNYQEVLKSMQRMSFGVNVEELLTVDQSKDPFK